jgi:endothelin-converting enzyme/putative endopeptidase
MKAHNNEVIGNKMNNSKRKIKKSKNKTVKKHDDNKPIVSQSLNLSQSQRDIVCKNYFNKYDTFEDKIEELFKKNKIDFSLTIKNLDKDLLRDFRKAAIVTKITPQNDFYSYINDKWLKDYELQEDQKYIVQVDNFRITQDKVFRELIEIVKDYMKNKTPLAKNMKNYYESIMNQNTLKQATYYANFFVNNVDELRKDKDNLWKLLGLINYNEIISWSSPFVWSLNPDDKNPKIYRCYIDGPKLSLNDINIYLDYETDDYSRKYRKRFLEYLEDLFTLTFGEKHGYNVADIFDCEIKIINAYDCTDIKNEDPNQYNIVNKSEALDKYGFDWDKFATELGFKKTPNFFITSNLNYIYCMTKLLREEWDNEKWKTYFVFIYIKQLQRFTIEGRQNFFNFQGSFVQGQEQMISLDLYAIYPMGFAFNTFLTNEYISKYKNQTAVDYVKTMAKDLRTVFIRIIKRNKWLQPKTKKVAIKKLEKFSLTVGSPELLRADPLLDYVDDDCWGNLTKVAMWRHENAVILEGKSVIDIPVMDWSTIPPKFVGTQAYVVNAMYTPSENGIYIPLGYIQKPFVDLEERGIEYNLAHIGFTIAHEMSHALDDWGSKYDENGRLNDWWTEKDKRKFKQIQDNVIKQYEVFASYDGIKFDAAPSIGEDLADISGFTICREYLRDFQLKNEDSLPIQKLSFESFFIYFAIQQRQKLSKKALEAQLKINPHPPDKYRCNVPLSRSPVFRAMFNIKKSDKMWWGSTNRVWED